MSEGPLAIGGTFLTMGVGGWIVGPTIYDLAGFHIRWAAFLFILVGLLTIAKSLESM